jgi:hypothetical protein
MTGNDHYGMDLSQIGLAEFKDQLKAGDLLPSQQVLLEDIDARFQTLAGMGLETLQDVVAALKTKPRLTQFAEKSGLALAYLNILRRKAKSYIPNPVYFRDIPGLDAGHVASLIAAGIKHTRHFFQHGPSRPVNHRRTNRHGPGLSGDVSRDDRSGPGGVSGAGIYPTVG